MTIHQVLLQESLMGRRLVDFAIAVQDEKPTKPIDRLLDLSVFALIATA
jgi:hypothetical protein